jgi:peptide/nickel transport system permease protein
MAAQLPDLAPGLAGDQRSRRGARFELAGRRLPLDVVIPGGFLVVLILACFLWPLVYPVPNPVGGSILRANLPPGSPGAILGTDTVGNDVLSQILYGGRVSFEIGVGVNVIGLVLGGGLGTVAGYWGGVFDAVAMRVIDLFIAFPALILALAIADGLGPSELHVIWALSFFSVPAFARIARAATLRVREQTFMVAGRLTGSRTRRILIRHVAPNISPQLATFALLGIGVTILVAGALSFLGYGVPPPAPSWGGMIALGAQQLSSHAYVMIIPSAFLLATVLALNALGDALRSRWGVQ